MIYIVRHGQTDWNLEGRYQGHIDIQLNKKGFSQAKELKEQLKDVKFDKVFCSPLKRAIETARTISDEKIVLDNRLIERYNGDLEGKLKDKIEDEPNFNDPNEYRYGIENIVDFRKRIKDFCDELKKDYVGKNILVVTHAGVSIYIRCAFEGEPVDGNYANLKIKNCEVLMYNND